MKKSFMVFLSMLFIILGITAFSNAAVIDFTGGTAYLSDGTSVTTTNTGLWNSVVDYYIEDGMMIDFVGGYGTIGDYYNDSIFGGIGGYGDSVIHAHPFDQFDIVFSKLDGSDFDLTYVDMTSNTDTGGGLASGDERSFITTDLGHELMLAPSDWGINYTFYADVGDGIVRNWMDSNFLGINSFTISSENAYCFGMDNFFIDQPPPSIPEPATLILFGTGLLGIAGLGRKKFFKK